jgi:hypothetical protein
VTTVSEGDLRKHPAFVEQTRGSLKKKLNMTIGYYRFIGIIKKTMMKYSRDVGPQEQNDVDDGYFDEPCYTALSGLNEDKRKKFLQEIARIICLSYDTEWWYIILQRQNHVKKTGKQWLNPNYEYPKELKDFPRTVLEFQSWNMKQGGSSFLIVTREFQNQESYVETKDDLMRVTLRGLTNTVDHDSKSKWAKSVTRHVTNYVMEELGRIRDVVSEDMITEWDVGKFQDILCDQFVKCRREPEDFSPSICWPTTMDSRMIHWRDFGPRILNLLGNELPHSAVPPVAPVARAHLQGKDVFFKNLVFKRTESRQKKPPQFNSIIILRLMIHVEGNKRDDEGALKNTVKNHWDKVRLPNRLSLLIFFESEAKLLECAKTVKKVFENPSLDPDLYNAATFNKSMWTTRGSIVEFHELFHYAEKDRLACDNGFCSTGNHLAFNEAQNGIITTKFLKFLIQIREEYNKKRLMGEKCNKEDIHAMAKIGRYDRSLIR